MEERRTRPRVGPRWITTAVPSRAVEIRTHRLTCRFGRLLLIPVEEIGRVKSMSACRAERRSFEKGHLLLENMQRRLEQTDTTVKRARDIELAVVAAVRRKAWTDTHGKVHLARPRHMCNAVH